MPPEIVGAQTLQDAHRIAALEPWRLRINPLRSRQADRRDNPVGDAFFNTALRVTRMESFSAPCSEAGFI